MNVHTRWEKALWMLPVIDSARKFSIKLPLFYWGRICKFYQRRRGEWMRIWINFEQLAKSQGEV
jgi:hypothetical protein